MIRRITYGTPFDTEAVTGSYEEWKGALPYLKEEEGRRFTRRMEDTDIVYGLGENVRGINKRGWVYVSKCSDDPNHREDTRSLYGAHNFLLVDGKETFGIFIDYPGKLTFDVGYTEYDILKIEAQESGLAVYIIEPDTALETEQKTALETEQKTALESDLKTAPETGTEGRRISAAESIVRQFRALVGRSYIPPKWAFGYGQSRWSYMDEDEIRQVVRQHRGAGIPLDAVYMDIDYMVKYKDFTVNEKTFPDFSAFVKEMKEQGVHLVPIIDAGVKIEDGYDVYEEGVKQGFFCKEEDGENYVCGVWPGRVHFPDMLNADARKWFGSKYKVLLDQGIDGFWNDMNEPAIFYSEKRLNQVFDEMEQYRGVNLDTDKLNAMLGKVGSLSNNEEDYKLFFHEHKDGRVRHDKVHNLFGYNMTRAAGEAFEALEPDKRILMFSRSSYIGMHRYGGIWTGDNLAWWSHILLNLRMMPALNMCGFLYSGADLGGFGADTTEDLLMRWLELGIFTPLMRNHSCLGSRRQEAYRFKRRESLRNIIALRYRLLPYIYSEFMKAALRGEMYFRPLSFAYPQDDFAGRVEDELLVGDSILIAPVYEQNAAGRYLYLPEAMKQIRCRNGEFLEEGILERGHHYVEIPVDELVFFIRPNRLVPVSDGGSCVEDMDWNNLKLLGYTDTEAVYELYDDDGYGKNYESPEHYTVITADKDGRVTVSGSGKTVRMN